MKIDIGDKDLNLIDIITTKDVNKAIEQIESHELICIIYDKNFIYTAELEELKRLLIKYNDIDKAVNDIIHSFDEKSKGE